LRTAILLFLLAVLATAASAQPDRLVPFSVEDQFKESHSEIELAGGVAALVWCDRASREMSDSWVDSLEVSFARGMPAGTWQIRQVAHTKGAPFFVKGKIRGSFSRDPDRWVLLDWKGFFRETYAPPDEQVTVLMFGSDGNLLARRSGWEVGAAVVTALTRSAAAAVTPRGEPPSAEEFSRRLTAAARERLAHRVVYDGGYRRIGYPGGDVPDSVGVCSDVVIRAYRALGVDLQREVHEDMTAHFDAYPDRWGLSAPDPNIDHRRVPNLQAFFTRKGTSLPVTPDAGDYRPGDVVTWLLPGNLPHIGIVVDGSSDDGARPLIVHNIGRGPRLEDVLFRYPLTGHYRYDGPR